MQEPRRGSQALHFPLADHGLRAHAGDPRGHHGKHVPEETGKLPVLPSAPELSTDLSAEGGHPAGSARLITICNKSLSDDGGMRTQKDPRSQAKYHK